MKSRGASASKTKRHDVQRQAREAESFPPSSASDAYPREQMIAEAAYFHAQRRGFTPANEMCDWLQADVDAEALLRNRS